MAHHKTDNENHSFRLMGEVRSNRSKSIKILQYKMCFWCKNGVKIETKARGRINVNASIKNPSLTINNVNHKDTGSY